jgi:hypothetical protein
MSIFMPTLLRVAADSAAAFASSLVKMQQAESPRKVRNLLTRHSSYGDRFWRNSRFFEVLRKPGTPPTLKLVNRMATLVESVHPCWSTPDSRDGEAGL